MIMTGDEFEKLYVKNGKILPNTVTELTTSLNLSFNNISVIENLPSTINGYLWLNNNNISIIQNLPYTINGSLDLSDNKISVINTLPNIINGTVWIDNNPIYKQFEKQFQFENQSKYKTTKDWAYAYLMKKKLDAWSNL